MTTHRYGHIDPKTSSWATLPALALKKLALWEEWGYNRDRHYSYFVGGKMSADLGYYHIEFLKRDGSPDVETAQAAFEW